MKAPLEQRDAAGWSAGAPDSALSRPLAADSIRVRFSDFIELAKLRISSLVLVVTAIGFCLASPGPIDLVLLFHTLVGTALTAAAANTINQLIERAYDRLMPRTMDRPIAAGRVSPQEAFIFGGICLVFGLFILALLVNPLATALAAATFGLYIFVYTPLKRKTVHNTLIGAVPGALPPMIGYAGASGELGPWAWALFGILFVWQLPHFFAIAWMYREDYRLGGYKMLSVVDPTGARTRRQTVAYTCVLILASLVPGILGLIGASGMAGAAAAGAALLWFAMGMSRRLSFESARLMLLASVIYLPILLILFFVDRVGV